MKKLVIKKEEDVITSVEEAAEYKYVGYKSSAYDVHILVKCSHGGVHFATIDGQYYASHGKTRVNSIQTAAIEHGHQVYCTNDINEFADWLKETS